MLTNRIALITGAANGIGESIAKIFSQYGAKGIISCDQEISQNIHPCLKQFLSVIFPNIQT